MFNEDEFTCEVLFDKVHVYRGVIKDPQGFVEILKDSEANPNNSYLFSQWEDWSVFGTYMTSMVDLSTNSDLPIKERFLKEKEHRVNIESAFKFSVDHFLSQYNLSVQSDWTTMGPSYCKYFESPLESAEHNPLAMIPHTDYQWYEFDSDKPKFAVTCTIYLNDTYEGGELIFTVNDKNEKFVYKPKAGDVVVFPSGHPDLLSDNGLYYHAVGRISKDEKYFIRCFYLLPNKASDKYIEYQNKYGKDQWAKMYDDIMQERIKTKVLKDLE
jgi:hypothetical protein